MNFNDNEMQIARDFFGLPEKCLFGLPNSLEEGMQSIIDDVSNIECREELADSVSRKVVAVSNLFSLLHARTLSNAYDNKTTEALFKMAKETGTDSEIFHELAPEIRQNVNAILEQLK